MRQSQGSVYISRNYALGTGEPKLAITRIVDTRKGVETKGIPEQEFGRRLAESGIELTKSNLGYWIKIKLIKVQTNNLGRGIGRRRFFAPDADLTVSTFLQAAKKEGWPLKEWKPFYRRYLIENIRRLGIIAKCKKLLKGNADVIEKALPNNNDSLIGHMLSVDPFGIATHKKRIFMNLASLITAMIMDVMLELQITAVHGRKLARLTDDLSDDCRARMEKQADSLERESTELSSLLGQVSELFGSYLEGVNE